MKKVILITTGFLTIHDYKSLEISNYTKNGIKFEIWNFDFLYKLGVNGKKIYCEILLSNFKHFKELIIKNKKNTLLFDVRTNFNLTSLKIFYYLARHDCKFILHVGLLRNNLIQYRKKFNFINKIKSIFTKKLLLFIESKIETIFFKLNLHKFYRLKHANFVYVIGKKTLQNLKSIALIGPNTQVVKGHHRNYDHYVKLTNQKKLIKSKNKFAVFIDQGVPIHPDWIKLGLNDVDIDKYYNSLRSFFLKFEKEFHIKVKISAHPKINIKRISKYFKGFETIQGKTLELIYKSKFVIAHDSTAVGFAIFLKKPVLFIINDPLKKSNHNHLNEIKWLASQLQKKVFNIDKVNIKLLYRELTVDNILYKKYALNYFKFSKSNLSYSNILIKLSNVIFKKKQKKLF